MTAAKDAVSGELNAQRDSAAHSVAAQRDRSRAQVAQYHQIRAALEKLRVSARSHDHSVTVEMAAGGAIVDLRLTTQAMRKTPDALAATILEAIRLGLAEVAQRTAASVEPLTGRRVDISAITQGRLPALSTDGADAGADTDAARAAQPAVVPASEPRFPPEEDQ